MKHPVDTSTWGEFKVGELFDLKGIKQVKSQHHVVEREDGIPFVVQSNRNNMVKHLADRQWLIDNNEPVVEGNAIVLGVTLPVVSYQESEFGASQVITARNPNLTKNSGLFIASVMTAFLVPKYSYINKPGLQKYKEDIIPLPLKPGTNPSDYSQDDIDWDYMESFMSRVQDAAKERLANLPEPGQKSKTPVDVSKWGEFKVGELFDCQTTNPLNPTKDGLSKGSTRFIASTVTENGIVNYYDDSDGLFTNEGNCITISAIGRLAFYQTEPFIAAYKVYALRHESMNHLSGLFICSLLNVNANMYNYANIRAMTVLKNETIPLPLKHGTNPTDYSQDDIDWEYMENFMSQFQNLAKNRVEQLF